MLEFSLSKGQTINKLPTIDISSFQFQHSLAIKLTVPEIAFILIAIFRI